MPNRIRPKPNQMKKLSLVLILLVLLLSCEKKDTTCNCDNPLEELSWLKELRVQLQIAPAKFQLSKLHIKNRQSFIL